MGQTTSRKALPKGTWDEDIDAHPGDPVTGKLVHKFEEAGYECKVVRYPQTWSFCGYVTLPPSHPDFSKTHRDLGPDIKIHGDLTFAGHGTFGFDCNHLFLGDVCPTDLLVPENLKNPLLKFQSGHYWTFDETERETRQLAIQFKARENRFGKSQKEKISSRIV